MHEVNSITTKFSEWSIQPNALNSTLRWDPEIYKVCAEFIKTLRKERWRVCPKISNTTVENHWDWEIN